MSKLYFRYGAMNSGKSTHLMQVAHNYEERGMRVILLKPEIDAKGGTRLVSRLGVVREVDLVVREDDNIIDLARRNIEENGKLDCILVDEVQFLKRHHVDELFELAVTQNIPTICYGLRTDFKMDGFEGSERLLLVAHSVEEMKTICKCGNKALLNGRKINGKFVFEGAQVAIDDNDEIEYESLCGECYFKFKNNK